MSLSGTPVSVVTDDGVTLAAHWHPVPEGTAMRSAMLLLPALAAPSRSLRLLADALAANGVGVLRSDYRYTGDSRPRPSRRHDATMLDLHQRDVPALLRELSVRAPDVPHACGGHSLGGQLSALAMATRPQVRAAVLLTVSMPDESLWPLKDRPLPWLAFRLMPLSGMLHGKLPSKPRGMGVEIPMGVIRDWGRWGRTGVYHSGGASLDGILQPARGKVLSVAAFDDTLYAPRRAVEAYLQKMPKAESTVWMLTPVEFGVRELGHFGLLRPPAAEGLGARLARWLSDALA